MSSKPRRITRPLALRERRLELVLTREQVADRVGVSERSIARWEQEPAGIGVETLQLLARALKCSPDLISEVVREAVAS